jgi:DNA-binding response OmpR family regulator
MNIDLKETRILIIDDQWTNIDVLENFLLIKGYTNIRTTVYSREAISIVQEFKPDIILLDLMMPHVSGFEVMKQLQDEGLMNELMPIMVLTADDSVETKKRALTEGAKDFLSKPFDLTDVDLRIRNMLLNVYLLSQLKDQNKLLEEKVNDRTEKLQHSYHELEEAKKLLEEKMIAIQDQNKTLKEISWIQSHVVRAPLVRMMSAASLFELEGPSKINHLEISKLILDAANELDVIVREITLKSKNAHLFEDLDS